MSQTTTTLLNPSKTVNLTTRPFYTALFMFSLYFLPETRFSFLQWVQNTVCSFTNCTNLSSTWIFKTLASSYLGGIGYVILQSSVVHSLFRIHVTIAILVSFFLFLIKELNSIQKVDRSLFEDWIPLLLTNITVLYVTMLFVWYTDGTKRRKAKLDEEQLQLASEASRAKSMFISNVSHDLRTPLQGILGLVDLLSATELDDLQRAYINNIASSGNNLLCVVNNVMDFTKIEVGKMEISKTTCDIFLIMQEIVDGMSTMSDKRGLEIYMDIRIELKHRFIYTDPRGIRQILINILGNAIKFTKKGFIIMSLQYSNCHNSYSSKDQDSASICNRIDPDIEQSSNSLDSISLEFSIQDSGCGIPKAFIPHCLEAFSQDRNLIHKVQGTGLGLSICQTLLKALGSKLTIESEVNQGSTFSFILDTFAESCITANDPNNYNVLDDFLTTTEVEFQIYLEEEHLFSESLRFWLKKLGAKASFYKKDEFNFKKKLKEVIYSKSEIFFILDNNVEVLQEIQEALVTDPDISNSLERIRMVIFAGVGRMLTYNRILVNLQQYSRNSLPGIKLASKPIGPAKLVDTLVSLFVKSSGCQENIKRTLPKATFSKSRSMSKSSTLCSFPESDLIGCDNNLLLDKESENDGYLSKKQDNHSKKMKPHPFKTNGSSPGLLSKIGRMGLTAPRVLMVEDNIINSIVLEKIFELWDIPVDLAENGQIAVEMWRESKGTYKLILMDAQMPVMDGFAATKEIRQIEKTEFGRGLTRTTQLNADMTEISSTFQNQRDSVVIIMMTALASQDAILKAYQAGVDDFLTKPVRAKSLQLTLQKHLGT